MTIKFLFALLYFLEGLCTFLDSVVVLLTFPLLTRELQWGFETPFRDILLWAVLRSARMAMTLSPAETKT